MINDSSQKLLIVDANRVPNARQKCAENDLEWGNLYLGTNWQTQLDVSPIWIKTNRDDPIWKLWISEPLWASSSVLYEYVQEREFDSVIASLQNIITAKCEDGRLFLFRFYSPKTLSLIAKFGDETVVNQVIGAAESIQTSPLLAEELQLVPLRKSHQNQFDGPLVLNRDLIKELLP
ncbi:DUF4123 domain-containing protein [Vibrio sp. SCSIO 43135]|uniref:DUF4123 domain-containing protein n=1 Tax=Vibrio sp. SCSIO 43135 TaxID=2819096 RepID=UPI0020754AA6|nr:DUF4123 domain-containing protein [Vibrio sp. SCSIO 43135]